MTDWLRFAMQAEQRVVSELEAKGWDVTRSPRIGMMRPDIVATRPDGQKYIFEFKVSPSAGSATFSDLAQTSKYAGAIRESAGVPSVRVVMATNLRVSQKMRDLSEALGVKIVSVEGDPQQLADGVMQSLEQHHPRSREDTLGGGGCGRP